ncbi:MAG TPA: hypothetical protein PLH27_01185 [bacterium]|nr:hypothetical protein [bacterium]
MIDIKHILTVGVDDQVKTIYEDYIAQLTERIGISDANAKPAFKALMNILITLEESGNIRKGYDSLPSLFITQRVLYMKVFDLMLQHGHAVSDVDEFWFRGKEIELASPSHFIDDQVQVARSIFSVFQPFLDADDDVDRFMRVISLYAAFISKKNDVGAMVNLMHHFAHFADKIYLAGYKKVHDGWGGKLDLDTDVYPVFFKSIIRDAIETYGFSDYVVDFLYDRLKEVGESETVLPDLYDFTKSLQANAELTKEIQDADKSLKTEIQKTLQIVQQQKGESLSENAQNAIVRELTAYEELEGLIYYYFDERRLFKIMTDTKTVSLFEKTLDIVRSYSPKMKHYVMYAFGKLLGAVKNNVEVDEAVVEMFCREIKLDIETINSDKVMQNLPAQYRARVPDLEVRFVFNRMMSNTASLEGFERVHDLFRAYLTDQTDFPLIHEMFIERAAEKRHASALMSFYVAALLVHELGDIVSDQLIKVLAGRLSLTYSFTRRLTLFQEIKKLRYEFDGSHTDRETLYYNGFDKQNAVVPEKEKQTPLKNRPFEEQWIILYHYLNNRELAQALRLLDDQILFDYIYKREHTQEEIDVARTELRQKVYKIIDDKFLDVVSNEEDREKRELESEGKFAAGYYGKYEKVRSILVAQFVASGWDMEVHELRRKGKRPLIKMTQTELLRGIKNIDPNRILEQYEYKEARENIDVSTLRKQVDARELLLGFVNRTIKDETAFYQKALGLSDEAVALLSYSSTKLRSNELRVELGVRQLVERLRADLGVAAQREPLPLHDILQKAFAGTYGKIDVKVIKKDKNGKPMIDPETGEEAEKTYTIEPGKFPDYLKSARNEIEALGKSELYRQFYLITLSSILSETFSSMTFIKEALATNKYVIAADGLKEQSLENQEIIEYARIKMDSAAQLMPFELQLQPIS